MNKDKLDTKNTKEFSTTKIIYLVVFLFIIGMVILVGSDTFDTPSVETITNKQPTSEANVHNGADLSKLQEIKTLEDQVASNPNNTDSLLKLAHLLNDSGFPKKAIDRYKNYLKLKPNEPDVIVDMGVCYYQTGDFDSAIDVMETAIKLNPKHQIANFNLGIVNSAAGNHEESLEWWRKAVEINPNSDIGKKAKKLLEKH